MPLLEIRGAGKQGKLGIWHINESMQDLLKLKKVSDEDSVTLNSFSNDHRKKEWLVARILTEQLTKNKDVNIHYDQHNKPSLKNSKNKISISHSHNHLAVILHKNETGIDLELIKPKIEQIKEKFMSKGELNALQKENLREQLTVHWCAKEALYKLYGKKELEFKTHLLIEPFRYSAKGDIHGWIKNTAVNKCFLLSYETLKLENENYILAYVD